MGEGERGLAASERLDASIIEGLQEGPIVVDLRGRVTRADQAAAELCGVSLGELVGSLLGELPIEVSRRGGRPLDQARSPLRRALCGETVRDRAMYARKAAS